MFQAVQDRPSSASAFPAVMEAMRFIRRSRFSTPAISVAVMIPLFWHRHLESCDLPSHTYNSWLAELIARGQAPGLHLVPQWQNVLFDYLLLTSTRLLGYGIGEKIAVAVCVMVFFWGAFALVSAVAGHACWRLCPLLVMLTYGWVFNEGLFNFYISVGLSFLVLALAFEGRGGDYFVGAVLLVLLSRAHILGLVCVLFAVFFVLVARRLRQRWYPPVMAVTSIVAFFVVRQYVIQHYRLVPNDSDVYWLAGVDQLVLFGARYRDFAMLLMLFCISFVVMIAVRRWRDLMDKASIPLLLYAIFAVAVYWSPGGLWIPGMQAQFSLLPDRVSVFTAALGCCVLACFPWKKWQSAALCVFALVFFYFLYGDTGRVNAAETRVDEIVQLLPPNQRVVGTLEVQDSRIPMRHIIDRACIGRCFSYANYEPASEQFRIRVEGYSPIVVSGESLSYAMQYGSYRIQWNDLPTYQIYFCGSQPIDICLAPWSAGILNSAFWTGPPPVW